jgi:adenine-specific DNA-methyltransferase
MPDLGLPKNPSVPSDRPVSLIANAELRRREAALTLLPSSKAALGQFMTPGPIAQFMASLFTSPASPTVRILDPGAGVGSLTAALVQGICAHPGSARDISATCYEIDGALVAHLDETLQECRHSVAAAGLHFCSDLRALDFIEDAAAKLSPDLFSPLAATESYTHAILNPPYKKIQTGSLHRSLLSRSGIETSNLYSAFVALAIKLLAPAGQLVAITPRSFCNGPYFLPFRKLLLSEMSILRIHTFEMRDQAFRDDNVLQENVIFLAAKGSQSDSVMLSISEGPQFHSIASRIARFAEIVHADDPHLIIHIPATEDDRRIAAQLRTLQFTLDDLSIQVSTGPVVDFRLSSYIHELPSSGTVPLLYPAHFREGLVCWPHPARRKPSAIDLTDETRKWLMPEGHYTITRRFSSKEERRRVVAAVFDPSCAPGAMVGFENHLNVFHTAGHGLPAAIARGLCIYLNSTLVDRFFRQFNGHTQVNASDLRSLRYPGRDVLQRLGTTWQEGALPPQEAIDTLVNAVLVDRQSR